VSGKESDLGLGGFQATGTPFGTRRIDDNVMLLSVRQ